MKNEINAWYNENDLILSPMGRGGPGQEHQQANLLLTKHLQNPSLMLAQNVPAAGRHRSTSLAEEHLGEFSYRGDATISPRFSSL
jgi:hypothetical protein